NEVFNKEFYEGLTSGSTVTADADFPANPAAPEGYHFKGWYLNGDVTAHTVDLLTAAEFTGDLVYQAVFEADPTSGAFLTVSMNSTPDKQQTSWWPTNLFKPKAEVKLSLQNTGTEGTSGSSAISFKMNGPIERVDCWNNVDITISGDTVYVTYKDVIYPADDPDGSHWRRSDTLTLYVYGSTEGDEATINAINFTASDLSNSTT
ncbi:MAG: hypothetical protein IJ555_15165, partial [Ruminococcus sp.]|nr:hypothetical protein [Ruminococcus sp.]